MSNEILTPEQIEAMLVGAGRIETEDAESTGLNVEDYLSKEEVDVLGEIGNICMGTSATTLYQLLGNKVIITTPKISVHTLETLRREYPTPIVVIEVYYTEGLDGNNILLLKDYDVALITDVLMGGDGKSIDKDNIVLDEIHLSAIREVMNQMVGSSATSLSDIIGNPVNISTPSTKHITLSEDSISDMITDSGILVKTSFKMEIEGLLSSEIMQVLPYEFAKKQVDVLLGKQNAETDKIAKDNAITEEIYSSTKNSYSAEEIINAENVQQPELAQSQYIPQQQYQQPYHQNSGNGILRNDVNAQNVQYPSFANDSNFLGVALDHIGMLMDVPMKVTVQLGKAKKKIKEIMDLNTGAVIVLDKLAGENVEILVNGVMVAKGEVVVVEDNYAVRITEINLPEINKNTD